MPSRRRRLLPSAAGSAAAAVAAHSAAAQSNAAHSNAAVSTAATVDDDRELPGSGPDDSDLLDPDLLETEVVVPEPPSPPIRTPLPVLAAIAPVVVSVAAWLVTGSVFALVFAALGPVVAFAGIADARLHGRRSRRHDARLHRAALVEAERRIVAAHDAERRDLRHRHPQVDACLSADPPAAADPPDLVVGRGAAVSRLVVTGRRDGYDAARLRAEARRLSDAPIVAEVSGGIALVGGPAATRAVARGWLLQLASRSSPDELGLVLPDRGWDWAAVLPHRTDARDRAAPPSLVLHVLDVDDPHSATPPGAATLSLHRSVDTVAQARTVAVLDGISTIRLRSMSARIPARAPTDAPIVPEAIAEPEAEAAAAVIARRFRGRVRAAATIPALVPFAAVAGSTPRAGLGCSVGLSATGLESIDLVADGPHAVVGGMTGSGKSEFLVTWVAAMAACHGPDEVSFLLVDFKGGSAFDVLATLPHCVGVITDLGHGEAERALGSLSAELRRREALLAQHRARDVERLDPSAGLARLVIVVDEFAAMLDAFPELHRLFTDLASRGRSLGIHLVLGTQRPVGIVRDALLANAPLRISLRVNNAADSRAVVGTDEAFRLPPERPGRAVIALDGVTTVLQVAQTADDDVRAVAERSSAPPSGRLRPWLPPLPGRVTVADLSDAHPMTDRGVVIGLVDRPLEQLQVVATVDPVREHLLVVGGPGSGTTTALDSICGQYRDRIRVVRPGSDIERLWDAVTEAADVCSSGPGRRGRHSEGSPVPASVLVLDDLDAVVGRLPVDAAATLLERLSVILRDGRGAGIGVVVSTQRPGGQAWATLSAVETRLVLRMATREQHLALGLPAAVHDAGAPPGRGCLRGEPVQVALPPEGGLADRVLADAARAGSAADPAPVLRWRDAPLWAVVTSTPDVVAARARDIASVGGTEPEVVRLGASAADPGSILPGRAAPGPVSPLAAQGIALPRAAAPGFALPSADRMPAAPGASAAGAAADHLVVVEAPPAGRPRPSMLVVGTVEEWTASWSTLTTLRGTGAPFVFDGCGATELRQLVGVRDPLPPCIPGRGRVWTVRTGGPVRRARWPSAG